MSQNMQFFFDGSPYSPCFWLVTCYRICALIGWIFLTLYLFSVQEGQFVVVSPAAEISDIVLSPNLGWFFHGTVTVENNSSTFEDFKTTSLTRHEIEKIYQINKASCQQQAKLSINTKQKSFLPPSNITLNLSFPLPRLRWTRF